jgi:hypothetical protein
MINPLKIHCEGFSMEKKINKLYAMKKEQGWENFSWRNKYKTRSPQLHD